jgi:hypothetical protein
MRHSSLPGGEVTDWLVSSLDNVPDLSQLIRTSTLSAAAFWPRASIPIA